MKTCIAYVSTVSVVAIAVVVINISFLNFGCALFACYVVLRCYYAVTCFLNKERSSLSKFYLLVRERAWKF
jgi:hypothetical protein